MAKDKKARGRNATASPAPNLLMYDVVSGPSCRLHAPMIAVAEQWKHQSYVAAGLCQTGGRIGHSAFLSPDQRTICIVGGQPLPPMHTNEVDEWDFTSTCDSSDGADGPVRLVAEQLQQQSSPLLVEPDERPATGSHLTIPAEYRTVLPLVECFNIAESAWFIPVGVQDRASLCRGLIRWPTQSGAVVAWGDNNASPGCVGKPPLASVRSPMASAHREPSELLVKPLSPVASASRSLLPNELQGIAEKEAEAAAAQQRPRWDGPAAAWVVGGWDGMRRLSTVFDYTTCTPGAVSADEVVMSSIPQVSELVTLPPISHASLTSIRDHWYLFGGNTVAGCTADLYVIDGPRLRQNEFRISRELSPLSVSSPLGRHSARRSPGLGNSLWECRMLGGTVSTAPGVSVPSIRDVETSAYDPDSTRNLSPGVSIASPSPPAATMAPLPAPPPRSSHAATVLQNRYLVIFGGRQLILPQQEPAARGRSKGAAGRKTSVKGAKEKEPKNMKGRPPPPPPDLDEELLPSVKLLNDVAVYDTEMRSWVQVRITGTDCPAPRYGAAMGAIPPATAARKEPTRDLQQESMSIQSLQHIGHNMRSRENPSSAANGPTPREIVVHGGFGDRDTVLNDLWVLHATSKGSGGSLVEMEGGSSGNAMITFRWIRVEHEVPPATPVVVFPPTSSRPSSGAGAPPSSESPHHAETPPPIPMQFPSRAQHSLVVTTSRIVYLIGGIEPFIPPYVQTRPLHSCVTSSKTDLVSIQLPSLETVMETAARRGSFHKNKAK